jgi:hypothetical protein
MKLLTLEGSFTLTSFTITVGNMTSALLITERAPVYVYVVQPDLLVRISGPIAPHGGQLSNLMVSDPKEKAALIASCNGVTMEVSDRGACDVELLVVGCEDMLHNNNKHAPVVLHDGHVCCFRGFES